MQALRDHVDPIDNYWEELHEPDAPLFVSYLFEDYFVFNDDRLEELLTGLISSEDITDKEKLNDIVVKIIDHSDKRAFSCLLHCGYKVEVMNGKDETVIHLAYANGFLKEMCEYRYDREFVESKINENYADSHGLSLLHIACDLGFEDTVKKFLDNKEELNAVYLSENYGDEETEGECFDNGFTPLHYAVRSLRFGIVKLLLENGANVNATDLWSRSPLHLASQTYNSSEFPSRDVEIMELLIENESEINMKDAFGNTPLLAVFGDFERNEWLFNVRRGKQLKKLELLFKYNADFTVVNNDGDSVLHLIIKDLKFTKGSDCDRIFSDDSRQVEWITKVLSFNENIDVNTKNKRGKSPLDLAISRLSSAIVTVLLELKADCSKVKFKSKKSYFECRRVAPNFYQIWNLIKIVDLLTENGFEVTEKDNATICKFLVHDYDDCECWHRRLHKTHALRDNVTNLFYYGSPVHISRTLERLMESDRRKNYAFNDVVLDIAAFHLKSLKHGDLFLHRQIEESVNNYMQANDYNKSDYSHWDVKLDKEITEMKSTFLKDKFSIFDMMTLPPNKIYKCIKDVKIDWKIVDKFTVYRNIIKAHVARSFVRNYLENSSFDRLKTEFFPVLFDHLCEEIFIYLSDEDILNMNLALMTSD